MKSGRILAVLFLVLVLTHPLTAAAAVLDALKMFYFQVLPSLMPCMVGALMLEKSGVTLLGQGRTAPLLRRLFGMDLRCLSFLALNFAAGFPAGAKIISEQHQHGTLSADHAQTLLALTSGVSPGFILGTLGSFFESRLWGVLILLAHWTGALLCGMLFAKKQQQVPSASTQQNMPDQSFFTIVCESIGQSSAPMLSIASALCFFSVLLCFLPPSFSALTPILEMTAGCIQIGAMPLGDGMKAMLLCGAVSFGGLCLNMQTLLFTRSLIAPKTYLRQKAVHGLISAMLLSPALFWG